VSAGKGCGGVSLVGGRGSPTKAFPRSTLPAPRAFSDFARSSETPEAKSDKPPLTALSP
jgi:hypothetical protein